MTAYDHRLALEAAQSAGRDFVSFAPSVLDCLMTSSDPDIAGAFTKILAQQTAAVRTAILSAGGSVEQANDVVANYRSEAMKARADRQRRAAR